MTDYSLHFNRNYYIIMCVTLQAACAAAKVKEADLVQAHAVEMERVARTAASLEHAAEEQIAKLTNERERAAELRAQLDIQSVAMTALRSQFEASVDAALVAEAATREATERTATAESAAEHAAAALAQLQDAERSREQERTLTSTPSSSSMRTDSPAAFAGQELRRRMSRVPGVLTPTQSEENRKGGGTPSNRTSIGGSTGEGGDGDGGGDLDEMEEQNAESDGRAFVCVCVAACMIVVCVCVFRERVAHCCCWWRTL